MKKILLIILTVLLFLLPSSAFALSLDLVPDAIKVETEDILQVEVDFRESGIGAVYASFSYDSALLEYIEGDGAAASDGQGSIVLYASSASANRLQTVLKFRAKAMGTAEIRVEVKEALSFEETPLDTPSATVEISTVRPADAYVIVEAEGARKQALCTPPFLPAGYEEVTVEIAGKDVTAARSGEATYVYLTEPDSETGSYYLRQNGEYLPAVSLQAERILLPIPAKELPEGFAPAELTINGTTYAGASDGTHDLIYAVDRSGAPALYLYDESDGSMQRYHEDVLTVTEYVEIPAERNITRPPILGAVFVLMLLAILVAAILKRNH